MFTVGRIEKVKCSSNLFIFESFSVDQIEIYIYGFSIGKKNLKSI